MARENQGLQIALIIFVMLTIILGVTTYLFYRQYDETALKAKANADRASKLESDNAALEDRIVNLKRYIGIAKTETDMDAIKDQFEKDMQKYGASYPEDSRYYRPLLEKLQKTIDERNAELADVKAEVDRLSGEFRVREANKDPQIKQFEEAAAKAATDRDAEKVKFEGERRRITEDQTKIQTDLVNLRKDTADKIAKVQTELTAAKEHNKKLGDIIENQAEVIEGFTKEKIEHPDGEVLWVNQREKTVWINLGKADNMARQVSFSVYPADLSNMTVKGKKGSIEVTRVLGEHLAEARVLDDQIADPIMPGDKIDTPLWSPNAKRHFALAGLMDIDGDGRSDLEAVINLIHLNGGEVDCYIGDKGANKNKVVGEITVNTNCLILGQAPTDKEGDAAQLEPFTKILRDAKQLRIPAMQLGDMLQRMGWKNMSRVVRYGRGANPNDFRAQPDDGVPRKSSGNVSDIYQNREPPKKAPSGAMYHRF
jgi:hypothetical protein